MPCQLKNNKKIYISNYAYSLAHFNYICANVHLMIKCYIQGHLVLTETVNLSYSVKSKLCRSANLLVPMARSKCPVQLNVCNPF